MASTPQLRQGLSQRQLNMIALGGVIGAGLFVGSGVVIKDTGPAAFLTYAICGLLIILVMRMLGEMAAANPSTGSFADYAAQALGGWAGFSVGWLYWYFWVIVVGFEAVAGGKVLNYWFPMPLWLSALCLMLLMTATNLFSVSSFGEFEFWFAGIKVATIVIFLVVGTLFAVGALPGHHTDFSNLTSHGGFFPKGVGAVFAAIVVVIFSMVGAEVVTIAAAESSDPERAVQRATKSVVARIAIFFVGSVFLLVVVLPWNSVELGSSPYVAALKHMGLSGADQVMNAVVLTAVLSCLNSGLYTSSRMLFVLADRHEAPARLVRLSGRGVPYVAILFSSAVGFGCVIMAWVAPRTVFLFLLNSSGAIILFVYWLIALSQIVLRRRTPDGKAAGEDVVFSGAVDPHARRNHRRAGADGVRPECTQSALAQPVVLGGGGRAVLWRACAQKDQPGPRREFALGPLPFDGLDDRGECRVHRRIDADARSLPRDGPVDDVDLADPARLMVE